MNKRKENVCLVLAAVIFVGVCCILSALEGYSMNIWDMGQAIVIGIMGIGLTYIPGKILKAIAKTEKQED